MDNNDIKGEVLQISKKLEDAKHRFSVIKGRREEVHKRMLLFGASSVEEGNNRLKEIAKEIKVEEQELNKLMDTLEGIFNG